MFRKPTGLAMAVAMAMLAALTILPLSAQAAKDDHRTIAGMVQYYVTCFNKRDVAGILDLYAPDARISESGLFSKKWLSVEEYAPKLRDKLANYDQRRAFIVDWDIEELDVNGDSADLSIEVRAKQGPFSARKRGDFELAKSAEGWKIVVDES